MSKTRFATSAANKPLFGGYGADEYELMLDLAKARARQARQDTLDEFGKLSASGISALWGKASRAGERLRHALQRHETLRKQRGA